MAHMIRSACFVAIQFLVLLPVPCVFGEQTEADVSRLEYAIAIHGGAGSSSTNLSDLVKRSQRRALEEALKSGQEILQAGGSSLDAVEKVIRSLEDAPQFNAGKGAVFNSEGDHELDASIMDGKTRACGAVAGVTIAKNPISLARKVMTETEHVMLSGQGADAFAEELGVETVTNRYFSTDFRYRAWQRALHAESHSSSHTGANRIHFGTVGCVALDSSGNLAAGTSTGGLTNKKFGRIGDSPIVGAGTFADNQTCAVSCTGIGEQFIRNVVAYDVSAMMEYRAVTLEESVRTILTEKLKPGYGGIIAVANDGQIVMQFNTAGMARGAADSTGRFEVLIGSE